jgi:rRNA maturation endonuclease Nob1
MDYRIECEECEEVSYITIDAEPTFCPHCGRRADAEMTREPLDYDLDDDIVSPDGC